MQMSGLKLDRTMFRDEGRIVSRTRSQNVFRDMARGGREAVCASKGVGYFISMFRPVVSGRDVRREERVVKGDWMKEPRVLAMKPFVEKAAVWTGGEGVGDGVVRERERGRGGTGGWRRGLRERNCGVVRVWRAASVPVSLTVKSWYTTGVKSLVSWKS